MKTSDLDGIRNIVKKEISQFLGAEKEFNWDLRRSDLSNWNSLNHIKLMVLIEKHLNIRFDVNEVASVQTPQDILALLKNKI